MKKKMNDYENIEKAMIYMKILKKGGSREKGGGGNEIHAPCACGINSWKKHRLILIILSMWYLEVNTETG